MALKGDAAFRYTPPGGSLTTVLLNVPLREIAPAEDRVTFVRESLDRTVREVTTVGDGVHEISALIRCIDNPQEVVDMLTDAKGGVALTYYPSLSAGTGYECLFIHAGKVVLTPDPERYGFGEWQTTVVLRRTSGATWAAIL